MNLFGLHFTHYESSALEPSNGEYLDVDAAADGGDCRFWYLDADRPSASGDGSDSADDEPGGDWAGL